ncbi:unnamed protein product [Closterium sp. NIES-64]|nr:unnamed protein product [Closterium sp. NIES-64]
MAADETTDEATAPETEIGDAAGDSANKKRKESSGGSATRWWRQPKPSVKRAARPIRRVEDKGSDDEEEEDGLPTVKEMARYPEVAFAKAHKRFKTSWESLFSWLILTRDDVGFPILRCSTCLEHGAEGAKTAYGKGGSGGRDMEKESIQTHQRSTAHQDAHAKMKSKESRKLRQTLLSEFEGLERSTLYIITALKTTVYICKSEAPITSYVDTIKFMAELEVPNLPLDSKGNYFSDNYSSHTHSQVDITVVAGEVSLACRTIEVRYVDCEDRFGNDQSPLHCAFLKKHGNPQHREVSVQGMDQNGEAAEHEFVLHEPKIPGHKTGVPPRRPQEPGRLQAFPAIVLSQRQRAADEEVPRVVGHARPHVSPPPLCYAIPVAVSRPQTSSPSVSPSVTRTAPLHLPSPVPTCPPPSSPHLAPFPGAALLPAFVLHCAIRRACRPSPVSLLRCSSFDSFRARRAVMRLRRGSLRGSGARAGGDTPRYLVNSLAVAFVVSLLFLYRLQRQERQEQAQQQREEQQQQHPALDVEGGGGGSGGDVTSGVGEVARELRLSGGGADAGGGGGGTESDAGGDEGGGRVRSDGGGGAAGGGGGEGGGGGGTADDGGADDEAREVRGKESGDSSGGEVEASAGGSTKVTSEASDAGGGDGDGGRGEGMADGNDGESDKGSREAGEDRGPSSVAESSEGESESSGDGGKRGSLTDGEEEGTGGMGSRADGESEKGTGMSDKEMGSDAGHAEGQGAAAEGGGASAGRGEGKGVEGDKEAEEESDSGFGAERGGEAKEAEEGSGSEIRAVNGGGDVEAAGAETDAGVATDQGRSGGEGEGDGGSVIVSGGKAGKREGVEAGDEVEEGRVKAKKKKASGKKKSKKGKKRKKKKSKKTKVADE